MIFLAVRYSFLFWLSISDSLVLPNMEADDQEIYRISACTARCLWHQQQQQQQNQSHHAARSQSKEQHFHHLKQQEEPHDSPLLEECYYFCRAQNATSPHMKDVKRISENLTLKLVCRDDRNLTLRIDMEGGRTVKSSATENAKTNRSSEEQEYISQVNSSNTSNIYVIKIHLDKKAQETLIYLSDDNFFTISDLKHNTTYNITAVVVHANNQYSVIAKGQQYRTLRLGFTPGMVQDIQIKDFHVDEANEKRLNVEIAWKPSVEMTCHYNIICFSPTYANFDLQPLEIRNPRQLYTYKLVNLSFSHIYRIGIRAKNPNNLAKESELFWKKVETPSCVEWYNHNFNICTPLEPQELEVEHNVIGQNEFSLNISWQQPEYLPDYYTLSILDLAKEGKEYIMNVSKLHSSVFLPRITFFGSTYQVNLTVYTPGGNSCAYVINDTKMLVVVADKHHVVKLISAILAPIFCFGILILTTYIICHRRAKLKRYQERCKYFEELEKKAPIDPKATFDFPTKNLPHLLTTPENLTQFQLDLEEKIFFNDAMEIDPDDITLYEVLGEGAFGLVQRGIYKDDKLGPREVAVKMLKDHPTVDDVRAFRREIEVMKSVERHPNIVGIIGHCTKRCSEMLLLTEYCSLGNLLNFLRNEWKYMHELNFKWESITMPAAKMRLSSKQQQIQQQQQQQQQQRERRQLQRKERQVNNKSNKTYNTINTTSNNSNNNNNNNNNNINVFNLDAAIIAKIRRKYKNLNASNTNAAKDYYAKRQQIPKRRTNGNDTLQNAEITTTTDEATTQAVAADNKSYGYDEICTNACKCQVDVLVIKDIDPQHAAQMATKQLENMLQDNKVDSTSSTTTTDFFLENPAALAASSTRPTIQIKNCNCSVLVKNNQKNVRMTQQAQQQNGICIENRGYYKYLPENVKAKKRANFDLPQIKNSTHGPLGADENVADNDDHDPLIGSAKREPLSAADLLDIAKQVAEGMEFLSKNKVVHRDLAARNVLVAPDRTIKIADFGLSRDVYQENIYKKTGNGKLPIKWLALESMTHQVYTTQSDVWSYGILLYEIVTLGGTPYPSIPTNRLLHLLKSGYRMEKPKNCGQDFYNLMYSCWALNPADRPNFTEIIKILENLLNEAPQCHIESMIMSKTKRKIEEVTSDDSYLKPL